MRRRVRLIDRTLLVLLLVTLVDAVAWICLLPPLQGPDEVSHFAYTQRLVETRSIPWFPNGLPIPGHPYSTEVGAATECSNVVSLWANPPAKPAGTVVDEHLCEEQTGSLPRARRADGGYTSAERNPPLYYAYAAIPYLVTYPASFFTREFAMRLANLPPLLVIVWCTWLLAGELLGAIRGGPWLRVLATAAVALNPQLMNLAATVNPDVLLTALWAGGLLLCVRTVKHGLTRGRLAGLALVCVAAGFTQGRGLPLGFPAVLSVGLAAWWARPPRLRTRAAAAGAVGVTVLGAIVVAYALLRFATGGRLDAPHIREFGSYLWQFYLPKPTWMQPAPGPHWGVRQAFVDRLFGGFAQLELAFSPALLNTLARLMEIGAALALVGAAVHWRQLRRRIGLLVVLLSAIVMTLVFLHVVAFNSLLGGEGDPIITGRYLVPLLPLMGVALALAVSWLPRRVGAVAASALVPLLAILQLAALGLVLERFYA